MEHPVGVIDASVLLAAMLGEITPAEAEKWIERSCISAVNLSEVVAKFSERGAAAAEIEQWIGSFRLDVRPFDMPLCLRAGYLRPDTKALGLSLGDRACLALAQELDRPAITADRAWSDLDLGITIKVIR